MDKSARFGDPIQKGFFAEYLKQAVQSVDDLEPIRSKAKELKIWVVIGKRMFIAIPYM